MAVKINLLPAEYSVSGSLAKTLRLVRTLNVVFAGCFIVFLVGLVSYLVFASVQLKKLVGFEENLKAQITASQQSEQQLVLVKDRISKILLIKSMANASANINKIDGYVADLGQDALLTELDVDSRKTDLSVVVKTNSRLTSLIKSIAESQIFKTVVLSAFGYNPSSGYLVSVQIQ